MKKFLLFCSIITLAGCAHIEDLIKQPEVSLKEVRTESFDFEGITLVMDVEISNPNPVGLEISGFDYRLDLEDTTLLEGNNQERSAMEANGTSLISVPLRIEYSNLAETIALWGEQDEAAYTFAMGITVPLPVLGDSRLSLEHSGTIPLLKLPSIKVEYFTLDRLTLSGADLILKLRVNNPNPFSIRLDDMNAALVIGGNPWTSLDFSGGADIARGKPKVISLPFHVDFKAIGRTAYGLLLGGKDLTYGLEGELTWGTSHPLLKKSRRTFELGGVAGLR